ncbi:NAD-dependent succinate-semialdehyde dehydrogenase [Winogradskyella sp. A3E31]|uniref:NAD-dependent succinate-semialdehyde dehydrogenase n=1 Tax=Winogradskyella sp. A3E31 TaxID=3349637 RepID=UPI00398AC173
MKNTIQTINPYTGKDLKTYSLDSQEEVLSKLKNADKAFISWKTKSISERTEYLKNLIRQLDENKATLAKLMTQEMGKPIIQSEAEIDKCIFLIEFYIENAENFLADAIINTDAEESFISYDPLGVILAIMPWNYPFWQVFRFAIPTITAGNTALLKHASNVTGCSIAIQQLFEGAGFPKGCFTSLITKHEVIENVLSDDRIKAVSLTGSEKAGKSIAEVAGRHLKKCVLELGGNNACIILKDANLNKHMDTIVNARMQNSGQSCIAAKRFIVEKDIYEDFIKRFIDKISELKFDNPELTDTTIGTLAREDLAKTLKEQVEDSIKKGAKVLYGNTVKKSYFQPTVIENAQPGMPVFDEETFGPVAAITKVNNKEEAFKIAAESRFGLGTMVFTKDVEYATRKTLEINDGAYFINEMVKSDPRLPFGGTKASGYGRELSKEGILEFVNKKTVYIKK